MRYVFQLPAEGVNAEFLSWLQGQFKGKMIEIAVRDIVEADIPVEVKTPKTKQKSKVPNNEYLEELKRRAENMKNRVNCVEFDSVEDIKKYLNEKKGVV